MEQGAVHEAVFTAKQPVDVPHAQYLLLDAADGVYHGQICGLVCHLPLEGMDF